MKKLFLNFIFVVSLTVSFMLSSAQTPISVTFKPGSEIGQDADIVYFPGDCIPRGESSIPGYTNYGFRHHLNAYAWTFSGGGCHTGYARSLIKFDELNTIPSNAIIISAELKLYGVTNVWYPGGIIQNNNQSYIQMVTSHWDENTVTWHTQPSTTTSNQILIPSTNSATNWVFSNNSANLIEMVRHMVSNPDSNFGFMLKLQTEEYHRSVAFASSENPNPKLWPELTVEYIIPCNSEFTYCSSSNSNTYTFNSFGPESNNMWFINGIFKSNSPTFEYDLPVGTNNVCHYLIERTTGEMCITCIDICVNQKSMLKNIKSVDEIMGLMKDQPLINYVEGAVPCNSEFIYCSSSNSNTYTFNSFGPESNNMWFVNNIFRSNSPTFEYDLPVGINNVCHYLIERTTGEMCVTCVDICISQNSKLQNTKSINELMDIMQNQSLTEDININKNFNSEIYPNPSSEEWNIKINAYEDDNILLDLKDISGKTIRTENKYISKGENLFKIDCKNLDTGIYILVIKGESYKLIKN